MAKSEVYVLEAEALCWKCGDVFMAVGLLATAVDGTVAPIKFVEVMSDAFTEYLRERFPVYQKRFVKATGKEMFVNSCPSCGITNGDKALHNQFVAGAPFAPGTQAEAKRITAYRVDKKWLEMDHLFAGKVEHGRVGSIILSGAKKKKMKRPVEVRQGQVLGSRVDVCPGCASARVKRHSAWLCYPFSVDVCHDCEWTAGAATGEGLYPGSFAVYDDVDLPEEAFTR